MKNKKIITIGIVALLLLGSGIAYANNSTNTTTSKQETTAVKDDKDKPKTTTSSKDESKESSEEKKESTNDSSAKNESEDKSSDAETTNTSSKSTSTKETTNKNTTSSSSTTNKESTSSSSNKETTTKPSTSTTQSHTHTWVDHTATKQVQVGTEPVYEDIYHEEVKHQVWVDEGSCNVCNVCGLKMYSSAEIANHGSDHYDNNEGFGYHYEEIGHYEWVIDQAAYTEKKQVGTKPIYENQSYVDYQYCSCGARK